MGAAISKPAATPEAKPDVARILHRYAEPSRPRYGTVIEADDGTGVLREILREIDETVLPRRIILIGKSGHKLTLAVTNRRLLWTGIGERKMDPPQGTPTEAAKRSASVLREFVARAQAIRIMPPERLDVRDVPDMSCSARSLAEAAGLTDWARHPSLPRRDVIAETKSVATAWAEPDPSGEFAACKGEEPAIERLRLFWASLAASKRQELEKKRIPARRMQCIILPLDDLESLVLLEPGDASPILALMPLQTAYHIASRWQGAETEV